MLRTHSERKKEGESLKPLTEREIQKKLYGSYYEEESSLKEESREEFSDLSKKPQRSLPPLRKKPSLLSPKVFAGFPWKKVFSLGLKGIRAVLGFLGTFLAKTATGVGIGTVVIAALFLGIYALNAYRATAIKNPHLAKPSPPRELQSETTSPISKPTQIVPPAPPAAKEPPPPSNKPYVIQVCTYVRQEDAKKLVDEMGKENLSAFIQPLERSNGKTFYPVFLGRFENFREAQAKLKEFRQKPVARDFSDSFIRTL